MWKNLTLFVAFPVIVLAHINAFLPHADGHVEKVRPDFQMFGYDGREAAAYIQMGRP